MIKLSLFFVMNSALRSHFNMNIPKLRFKEFSEEWEEKKLGDIATFLKGKGISKSDIIENGTLPCIRYGELYTKYNEVIKDVISKTNLNKNNLILSQYGDVIIPASGEKQIDIARASCVLKDNIALSGDLNIIKSKEDGVFLSYSLNNTRKIDIARLSQGISVVHLYSSQLKLLKLNLPKKQEQEKIVNFLTSIDTKITQLTKKEALLKDYKKGVMQKIFNQEIRFKDENGKDFDEWGLKKVKDVFERVKNKNIENNQNVLTISAQQGLINQEKYFNKSVSAKDVRGYYLLENGDFAYNKSYSKGYPMGAIKRLNRYKKGVVSTLYICFRSKKNINPIFYEKYFNSGFMNKELHKIAQEGARNHGLLNMSVIEFFNDLNMPVPPLEEQTKIANFLSSIDKKIEQNKKQLEDSEKYKKALLQQMFI